KTETTGKKNVADESQEIQDFLYEMYQEGMLQDNSDYDLSIFEERAKKEGITIGDGTVTKDLDVDQVVEGTRPEDSGFNL
ncbi:MAG: hypothetical protein RR949_07465, partial [Oscillospiraceae bacterium]